MEWLEIGIILGKRKLVSQSKLANGGITFQMENYLFPKIWENYKSFITNQ
jgi:hypothetical protein